MARKPNPKTCEKCPHRFEARGCPAWIEPEAGFVEKNNLTGEQRLVTGCFYQVIPKLMALMVADNMRVGCAMESWREDMTRGFTKLATAARVVAARSQPIPVEFHEVRDGEQGPE